MNDIIWDSIKPMVFFVAPLMNLGILILWRASPFYEHQDYPGEGRHYWHRSYEKNKKKRKRNNRFFLILLLGGWNLIMLYFILYTIYR